MQSPIFPYSFYYALNLVILMNSKIGILSVLAALTLTGTLAGLIVPVDAQECQGISGFDRADCNVHENTPGEFGGEQDVRFHEGTCQGGREHFACDLEIVTDPGNSDEHRQDNNDEDE
jgi:hypothetical protein